MILKIVNLVLIDKRPSHPSEPNTGPYMFQFLDLGFSSLQILQEHSLYFSAQNLLVFLDHNFIDTIHENTFSGFPPSGLDVSNNNLATLDQIVFQVRSEVDTHFLVD